MSNTFDKSFEAQYVAARLVGDKRFGSACKHDQVRNGYCLNCLRKVYTGPVGHPYTVEKGPGVPR